MPNEFPKKIPKNENKIPKEYEEDLNLLLDFEKQFTKEKIHINDYEWGNVVEFEREKNSDKNFFGEDYLKSLDVFKKNNIKDCPKEILELYLTIKDGALERVHRYFKSMSEDKKRGFYDLIVSFLNKKSNYKEIGYIVNILPDDLRIKYFVYTDLSSEKEKIEIFSSLIFMLYSKRDFKLPEEFIEKVLRFHKKDFLKNKKEILSEIKILKPKLENILINKSEKNIIPVKPEVIKKRLNQLRVDVVDNVFASFRGIGGDYNPNTHTIRISSAEEPERIYQIYTHEVMHGISDNILLINYHEEYGKYDEITSVKDIRSGVSFRNDYLYKGPDFTWLNEAITESLTEEIVGIADSYENERKLFNLFIENGVPKDIFYKAYFEDYENIGKIKKNLNAREMFDFLNKKFGARFLINLSYFIEEFNKINKIGDFGAKEACILWQEKKEEFPVYLNSWVEENIYKKR